MLSLVLLNPKSGALRKFDYIAILKEFQKGLQKISKEFRNQEQEQEQDQDQEQEPPPPIVPLLQKIFKTTVLNTIYRSCN